MRIERRGNAFIQAMFVVRHSRTTVRTSNTQKINNILCGLYID